MMCGVSRNGWAVGIAGLFCGLTLAICGGPARGAEWGDLSGRFLFAGAPPAPEKLKITSDQPVCGKHDLCNETLLVDAQSKGIKNIVVYLYQNKTPGRATAYDKMEVPIHDDYLALEKQPVKIDNLGCRFEPHIALVWTRQKVVLGNSDPVGHNVKIDCQINETPNEMIASGGTVERTFATPERMPAPVSCSVHPWMKAWVVIRDTPYMAVTDADGKFTLKNLPVGEWQFMFWQERAGYVSEVTVGGKAEQWKRGIKTITIKPGKQDLGDMTLSPTLFK